MNVTPPLSQPFSISDAMLTSATAVDVAAQGEWSSGTTYALADIVSRAQSAGRLKFYKSLQAGNLNQNPDTQTAWWQYIGDGYKQYSGTATYAVGDRALDNTNHRVYEALAVMSNPVPALTDTTKWLFIGPSNRWAMFDLKNNFVTSVPTSMVIVVTPGVRINAINLHGLRANSATISITSGVSEIFSETIDLNTRRVLNAYDYAYEPFTTQKSLALFNLPQVTNSIITITLTALSGNVECANCVINRATNIGAASYNAVSSTINFSTFTRNFDGTISELTQRRSIAKNSFRLIWDKLKAAQISQLRKDLNAVPASWSGLDDNNTDGYFEPYHVVGVYSEWDIDADSVQQGVSNLTIQEV